MLTSAVALNYADVLTQPPFRTAILFRTEAGKLKLHCSRATPVGFSKHLLDWRLGLAEAEAAAASADHRVNGDRHRRRVHTTRRRGGPRLSSTIPAIAVSESELRCTSRLQVLHDRRRVQ